MKDTNCSLTEIHVYVLANVIRRPIIVYSRKHVRDLFGNDMAPCYFGGVCACVCVCVRVRVGVRVGVWVPLPSARRRVSNRIFGMNK